jgi:hypothetical protein
MSPVYGQQIFLLSQGIFHFHFPRGYCFIGCESPFSGCLPPPGVKAAMKARFLVFSLSILLKESPFEGRPHNLPKNHNTNKAQTDHLLLFNSSPLMVPLLSKSNFRGSKFFEVGKKF